MSLPNAVSHVLHCQQGAALQGCNNELIKCFEDLFGRREDLQRQILQHEEEKQKIQNDLRALTERLAQVNHSLVRKIATRDEYGRTIAETENAYRKILESSHTLLNVLKRETTQLKDKPATSRPPEGSSIISAPAPVKLFVLSSTENF